MTTHPTSRILAIGIPAVAVVAVVLAGAFLLWPADVETSGSDAKEASVGASAQKSKGDTVNRRVRVSARPPLERRHEQALEPTPEQAEKRARIEARDAAATEQRRRLFDSNLVAVDAAIEKAEAEGGHPDYVAALRQRRALLEDQAESEAAPAK